MKQLNNCHNLRKSILLNLFLLLLLSSCQMFNSKFFSRGPSSDELFVAGVDESIACAKKSSNFVVNIKDNSNLPVEKLEELKSTVNTAVRYFEKNLGEMANDINIEIGGGGNNLQIGYVPESDTIYFREVEGVLNMGLDSIDVINHEVFHALMCRKAPSLCDPIILKKKNGLAVHEAFADYFAYQLNPDDNFGEDFYFKNRAFVRTYHSDLYMGLTNGEHAIGNIIVSYLLKYRVSFKEVWGLVLKGDLSIEQLGSLSDKLKQELEKSLSFSVKDYPLEVPFSEMRRYRLSKDILLTMVFEPNASLLDEHPDLKIQWVRESDLQPSPNYTMSPIGNNPFRFTIKINPGAKVEKDIALFISNGAVIGGQVFYFGPAIIK